MKNKTHSFAALLLSLALLLSCVSPAMAAEAADSVQDTAFVQRGDLKALSDAIPLEGDGADTDPATQSETLAFLLRYAGLAESQLGNYPNDYEAMAVSMGMLPEDYDADASCSQAMLDALLESPELTALQEAMAAETKAPLFLNGAAQPIFPYTTGAVHDYDNAESDIIRYCVYVETNHDTDNDGKLDLVKALVQLPRAAAEGDYLAGTIYEARPYITGCTDSSMEYVDEPLGFDMYASPAARVPAGSATTMEAAAGADSADWYYYNPYEDFDGYMCYEDLTWYDYYLVRGFAVVEVGGLGTRGSEGFETCGSDLEIDAFKCVIEWLTGDRAAYTDKTSNIRIDADWSNGKVGMTGRSYAGTTQFGLAGTGVKGLETIVPVAGIASWYEYTNAQGIFTRWWPAYTDSLASYCAGRYLDSTEAEAEAHSRGHNEYVSSGDYETIRDAYSRYLNQMEAEQLALNGDYGHHWAIRDYTTDQADIQCSALIVHGLNDYNVRPKEFDLMYRAFQKAGQPVKLLLHQDGHLTPTYPSQGLSFHIGDESYDEILNVWFSHYLYGLDNGAEDMAAVTAQDSHSVSWHTYDTWEAAGELVMNAESDQETVTLTSNDQAAGITRRTWKDVFTSCSTAGSALYAVPVDSSTLVKGPAAVHFRAAVSNAANDLPEGTAVGRDALMVSAMLVDIAPEGQTFPVFKTRGSYVPKNVLEEGGAWMGGGLPNMDLVEHKTSDVSYNIITRGWMDLYNPNAGYDSASAAREGRVELKAGEYNDYTIYLQPTLYDVPAGHTLALVIYADEPGMSYYKEDYTITLDQSSVRAAVPVDSGAGAHSAVYDAVHYKLDVSATSGGTVSSTVENGMVTAGTQAVLTASPAESHNFSGWLVDGEIIGKENPLTITVTGNTVIKAVFTENTGSGSHADAVVTYPVKVSDAENGTVTASADRAQAGETVRLTVSADAGCTLRSLTVTDKTGSAVQTAADGADFTFVMPASTVTVQAVFSAAPAVSFSDVDESAYYKDAVYWAVDQGITKGLTGTAFAPDLACTRAQAVTFLWRSAGSPAPVSSVNPFKDVAEDAYCKDAVLWAVEQGITKGLTADTFAPGSTVTRGQFMTFLFRAADGTAAQLANPFTDVADGAYYHDAVLWAVSNGVTNGTTASTFTPDAPCTRAQIVTFLWRNAK